MKKYMVIDDAAITPEEFFVAAEMPSWVEANDDGEAKAKIAMRRDYIKKEAARRLSANSDSTLSIPTVIK